ncbi:2,5-dihydroxypyridine 5,6-dioxygenase [Roseiarcaceae bacterium H3SJ34-1]|uniref:2,5-dihydroxypyridine 5,6-dioxygenase n=1 Tax=Terripilifer ovatus TaxID=3032367 RepID=UPI003AB98308|nr:2,5-dihydroxypyridine 5,6-dioxygenase [Roseiarcaceae bacterium H3SJ34-1]
MSLPNPQLLKAWKHVLTLSKVKAGEAVTLLVSSNTNQDNQAAAYLAANELGATVTVVSLPQINTELSLSRDKTAYVGATALQNNKAALAALQNSDLVIDLMLLLFSPEQAKILESGARMLLAVEPPEVLMRILPSQDDKRRVLAAEHRLKRAKTMRIESAAGTALHCEIGGYPVISEYGFADEPGRWDHWPSGFLVTWPNEKTTNGTVVLDRGDIIFPFKDYLRSPIELDIANGYISDIRGGQDSDFLKSYMAYFKDPEVYAVSHLGWGLQPKAQWTALGMYNKEETIGQDGRAFYGNFLFSTGPNTEAGGNRNTPCHLDIPMRNCSVFLDDEPMTVHGEVIPEDQKAVA